MGIKTWQRSLSYIEIDVLDCINTKDLQCQWKCMWCGVVGHLVLLPKPDGLHVPDNVRASNGMMAFPLHGIKFFGQFKLLQRTETPQSLSQTYHSSVRNKRGAGMMPVVPRHRAPKIFLLILYMLILYKLYMYSSVQHIDT